MPDQLKLPFALWARHAVTELIRIRSTGRNLKRWGYAAEALETGLRTESLSLSVDNGTVASDRVFDAFALWKSNMRRI